MAGAAYFARCLSSLVETLFNLAPSMLRRFLTFAFSARNLAITDWSFVSRLALFIFWATSFLLRSSKCLRNPSVVFRSIIRRSFLSESSDRRLDTSSLVLPIFEISSPTRLVSASNSVVRASVSALTLSNISWVFTDTCEKFFLYVKQIFILTI